MTFFNTANLLDLRVIYGHLSDACIRRCYYELGGHHPNFGAIDGTVCRRTKGRCWSGNVIGIATCLLSYQTLVLFARYMHLHVSQER